MGRDMIGNSVIFIFLAISLLLSLATARGVSLVKVPLLLGYIVTGAIIGLIMKYMVPADSCWQIDIVDYDIVNTFTLSLIGFGIGTELEYRSLRKIGKTVLWITFCEATLTYIIVGLMMTFVLHFSLGWRLAVPIGLLFGSFASATAPAGTVDVIKEYKAKGTMVTTLFAVLGLDDIFALLIYTITLPIAITMLGSNELSLSTALLNSGTEIILSILFGGSIGVILSFLGKKFYRKFMILYLALGNVLLMCGIAEIFNLSPILINMIAGIVLVNRDKSIAIKLNNTLTEWSPVVYVWFFVLLGSKIDLTIIQQYWVIIIVYICSTMFGKYNGAYLGAVISNASEKIRKYLGFTLLSQAGVAIGLSIAAGKYLTSVGYEEEANIITSIMTVTTFLIMIIAPNFVKYGLVKSGEAKISE